MLSATITRPVGRRWPILLATCTAVLLPALAQAKPSSLQVVVPPSAEQHGLTVRVEPPHVWARACSQAARCKHSGGDAVTIDIDAAALPRATAATLRTVSLSRSRRLVELSVPGDRPDERYVLLLAPSLRRHEPAVLKPLSGWLGRRRGPPGEQHWNVLVVERTTAGSERLIVGKRYDHLGVCGRPTVMRTRQLDPETLDWVWISADSLSAAERSQATPLTAQSTGPAALANLPRLLRATTASSAVGRTAGALTDGKLSTAWTEDRPGDGGGEFVLLSASQNVAITGFELVVRPEQLERRDATAPRLVFVATDDRLFRIELPADAWQQPAGTSFTAQLSEPLRTRCAALVLGSTEGSSNRNRTTVAELRAITELEDDGGWRSLVDRLDGSPEAASSAATLLSRSGPAALRATMAGYARLSGAGRRRALQIISAGQCSEVVGFFIARVLAAGPTAGRGGDHGMLEVVRDRLRECGARAAEALAASMAEGKISQAHCRAAGEIALFAPERAVTMVADVLHRADDDARRELRSALSTAAGRRGARKRVDDLLSEASFAARPLVTRIDVLRSIGPGLARSAHGAAALQNVLDTDRSFRTRYLLLTPAGHLARNGDRGATAFLRQSLLADPSPYVRAQAARAAADIPALGNALERASADRQPRVRQAALEGLAAAEVALNRSAEAAVGTVLRADPWTFVREAAADALAGRPPSASTDEALLDALEDDSSQVRAAVLDALGQRRSAPTLPAVRDVVDQPRESMAVRKAAIRALGAMCDVEAVDLLTKLAQRAAAAQLPYDRPLGEAALLALGRIRPSDLRQRLAPLLAPRAPANVRRLAISTLRTPGECPSASGQ